MIIEKYCSNMDNLSFNYKGTVSSSDLKFKSTDIPYCSTKVITIDVADYMALVIGNVYKFEIYDKNTGAMLDKTYIYCNNTKSQNAVAYGQKIYNYSDGDNAKTDVINNNPTQYYNYQQQGKGEYNSNYDTIQGNISYNGNSSAAVNTAKIEDILGALNSSLSGVGMFFQMCYSVFPPIYITILSMGAALLVILRVLGR